MSRALKAPAPTTLEARVEQLTRQVETLLTIVAPIVTRRVSNERQAKIAGVSRTTLWRRRRRAAAQLALRPRTAA
jgi:DNA polymerase III delta subunit